MKWTAEKIEYFRRVYPYNSNVKIAKHFGCSYSAVKNLAVKLNIQKDESLPKGYFPKGHIPWNKGRKGLQIGGKETQFKTGHLPHNTKTDGIITIRRDTTGRKYKYIRIAKGVWNFLHRYLWESKYGKIPRGMVLVFRDGDTMNCDLDNLELITRRENMDRNRNYEKAKVTLLRTWEAEKIRRIYGLKPKTKLLERYKRAI